MKGPPGELFNFILRGGRVFCIETYPSKASGLQKPDAAIQEWVNKMKGYPDRFILVKKPAGNFIGWYEQLQQDHSLKPYVDIRRPQSICESGHASGERKWSCFFFINSNRTEGYGLELSFAPEITAGRQPWLWDAVTGERFRLTLDSGKLKLHLGPADSKLIVFDTKKRGRPFKAQPGTEGEVLRGWSVEWRHIDGTVTHTEMEELKDAKDIPAYSAFGGMIIYRKTIHLPARKFLRLGKVFGESELSVNGISKGVQWYGDRIYALERGESRLEIRITTTLGNYCKTLTENPIAQYWTNEKRKNQSVQSMGIIGPIILI